MAKVIVSNFTTLDGLYEGPGRDIGPLFRFMHPAHADDDQYDHYNAGLLRRAGHLLLSHNAFIGNRDYWTARRRDAAATPIRREIAELMASVPKLVPSDRLGTDELGAWSNSTIIPRARVHDAIARMRAGEGGDILVMLSRKLWLDLLEAGLVDEVHLVVFPIVGGEGQKLFEPRPEVPLRLLEVRGFERSGNAVLIYEPGNRR